LLLLVYFVLLLLVFVVLLLLVFIVLLLLVFDVAKIQFLFEMKNVFTKTDDFVKVALSPQAFLYFCRKCKAL